MSVELLDLIDKLGLSQKTINDLNHHNIFYIYELLTINPNVAINQNEITKHYLKKMQKREIVERVHSNNYKFTYEMNNKQQQNYYNYVNELLKEKNSKEIENRSIDYFNFPTRVRNSLIRSDYDTLLKMSKMTILDLKRTKNLGTASINIILNSLHSLGIYLHGEDILQTESLTMVKNSLGEFEEDNLFLIQQAKERFKSRKKKKELLEIMNKLNRTIEISDRKEKRINNELISYIYIILDALKDNSNKDKIEEIEKILKTLYALEIDNDAKILKKEK